MTPGSMIMWFRFAALFLLMPCVAGAQSTEPGYTPVPWTAPEGSVELWNGHDLAGWTLFFREGPVPGDFWSAKDGVLHLTGTPTGYLRTEKAFANYHLHAEWRWPQTPKTGTNNSGIFVGQRSPDAVWPFSVQVQLKTGAAGDLIAQGGAALAPGSADLTAKKTGDANEKPDGKWNGADVYCRGSSIEVFINGVRQNYVDKVSFDSGQIALQSEGYPVEFRNVWLQPLYFDAATPLEWSTFMARSEIERRGRSLWRKSDDNAKGGEGAAKGSGDAAKGGDGNTKADEGSAKGVGGSSKGGENSARWGYTTGLYADALLRLSDRTNDPVYARSAVGTIDSYISSEGKIATYPTKPAKPEADPDEPPHPPAKGEEETQRFFLDDIQPGVITLKLYDRTHDEKYRKAADLLRAQLRAQPRISEGGFWHKKSDKNQMWLDGLYMAEPFYASYAAHFNEPQDFDDIVKQFKLVGDHTYDPKTSLFYHGWDAGGKQPWANPKTGVSTMFWGRALGWYAMALVDVLDSLPADHPKRADLIDLLQKVRTGLLKYQDPKSGVWWQVIDQGERRYNYLEASSSCMFVYALAKGVNHGYLPRTDIPAIHAGYQGLIRQFILMNADQHGVNLTGCCEVANLDVKNRGSFDYYTRIQPIVPNDLKGVGPFITAGLECDQLFGTEVFSARADDAAPRQEQP